MNGMNGVAGTGAGAGVGAGAGAGAGAGETVTIDDGRMIFFLFLRGVKVLVGRVAERLLDFLSPWIVCFGGLGVSARNWEGDGGIVKRLRRCIRRCDRGTWLAVDGASRADAKWQ
jgi:hypothetical protein